MKTLDWKRGMQTVQFNREVFFAQGQVVGIESADLTFLEEAATRSPRCRARVCAHEHPEDALHEMFVVLTRDGYLIPEKHVVKVESYHIVKGEADVVIFDDDGDITDVVQLGDYDSGRCFYFRARCSNFYHSLLIRSDFLLYHESATGPFRKSDTVVAPWAPAEADIPGRTAYLAELERRVDRFVMTRGGAVRAGV